MTENQIIHQPSLFEQSNEGAEIETILLYALGEFQSRGKVLANRELALDRLRGAFKRASERFGAAEFPDEMLAKHLEKLGAKIVQVPNFVAKHPFRVTVFQTLANQSAEFYKLEPEKEK